MIKLDKLGIRGHMYRWIGNFYKIDILRFKVGKDYSSKMFNENGTPPESIISPLLFSIMINDIFEGG